VSRSTNFWHAMLLVVYVAGTGPAQERTDAGGDPLPKGAVGRLGVARWRLADEVVLVQP